MKPNTTSTHFKLESVSFRIWAVLAVVTLFIDSTEAIRVYEGTNFPDPIQKLPKTVGFSKKSLYISKRSWSPGDEKKLDGGRSAEGKFKDVTKRTGTEAGQTLYKIKFTDKNYMQYLKYIKDITRLEEYTFCLWYKLGNLSHDQTLFTYSLNKDEVLLRFWINAADTTLRMAIRENPVFKVPAHIRENKWHHICQAWNGVLGEWQVFFDGKRTGAGVLSHYKGTYIPEGGEITLGQELIGLTKRPNDGMDGELFGFNLVDESVPQDQAIFINSQYKPNVQGGIPPFKKLPPIKKTYQEIKAYISSLPSDPSEVRKKNEGFLGETSNAIKKPKDGYSISPKRNRGNHRLRYPPLRKVVVYNRDDRQLSLDEASIELNKTKPVPPPQNQTAGQGSEGKKETQLLDVNYSIHSYRSGREEGKTNSYEIYEVFEDEGVKPAPEELTNDQSLERKARQNFNLFTARQANKVYTLSSSVKDSKKPKFHFETRTEKPEGGKRRSFDVEESGVKTARRPAEKATERIISDAIPVYEVEINGERKKRSTNETVQSRQVANDDPLTDSNGFRRLPEIPESFINIFTQNASRSEMEEKIDRFFPESNSSQKTNVVAAITEAPEASPVVEDTGMMTLPATNKVQIERLTTARPIPSFLPIPPGIPSRVNLPEIKQPLYAAGLSNPGPVNFPAVQDFNPGLPPKEMRSPVRHNKPVHVAEAVMERRFDVSSGTDLVMRSYGECTADRGSPVREKQHLVVSWADTPVRIFGGAQVEGARNQCGHF